MISMNKCGQLACATCHPKSQNGEAFPFTPAFRAIMQGMHCDVYHYSRNAALNVARKHFQRMLNVSLESIISVEYHPDF